MKERYAFFERLLKIKDYWVEDAMQKIESSKDITDYECSKEYIELQKVLQNSEDRLACRAVLDDAVQGLLDSFIVMIGGALSDLIGVLDIDLINKDTKQSLREDTVLHEEFYPISRRRNKKKTRK